METRFTILTYPVEEEFDQIQEKYLNKWVAIHQPDYKQALERGTVVAYADASCGVDVKWSMQDYLKENFGRGTVKLIAEEDLEE